MTKKLHRIILLIPLLAIFLAPLALNTSVSAKDCAQYKNSTNDAYDKCMGQSGNYDSTLTKNSGESYFLSMVPWYHGTRFAESGYTPSQEELVSGIVQIAVNILTDFTIIAAYLVLGYVIYGGYLYIFSAGDPSKVATGKKALTQAFIGLAIVMSANLIMSTIRFALMGANGSFRCDLSSGANCIDANSTITHAIQWFIGIAGAVAAIFVVYGGIAYATSAGDPSKVQKAKQMITYALIGMAVVGLAEVITAFVSGIIRDADNQATSLTTETIISKEINYEKIN